MSSPPQVTPIHELVIAFLSTAAPENARRKDLFETDEAVILWLEKYGFSRIDLPDFSHSKGLAVQARALREVIREMMIQRKMGGEIEVVRLNRFLAAARYTVELIDAGEGRVKSIRKFASGSARQVLSPVALAAADLLANGDLRLLKKCEGEHCTMWFYDGTKARRRRWCNVAICGNRSKIARVRLKAQSK